MTDSRQEQDTIRLYLLGNLAGEDREAFERRLFTEKDDLFEELLAAEDELVDDFLTGALTADEAAMFEKHFLVTDERRQKLRLGKAFRKYAETASAPLPKPISSPRTWNWQQFFTSSLVRAVALSVVILIAPVATWRIFFYQSDVDKGLVALNEAYRAHRPFEARISKFIYAPYSSTRGGVNRVNTLELDHAERYLRDAARDDPGATSSYALGKFYLATKDFDQAIQQFEQALKDDPNNAQIHADLGVALLEKGRAELASNSDKGREYFARSLAELNRSLELDESMLEALFNRALLHREMLLPRQATEDWKKYLEKDLNSPWADEARRNLQLLDEGKVSPPSPSQMLDGFLAASQSRDDDNAWKIMSRNKEMITGRFIPQQLAKAYLKETTENHPQQAKKFLEALNYAGELEIKRAHDSYVSDMAAYYARATTQQREMLSRAQTNVAAAYDLCQQNLFKDALNEFINAKDLFAKAGDLWEEKLLDYWIGYCLNQVDLIAESIALLRSLEDYCKRNNYKWLFGHATCWLATNYAEQGNHSRSIEYYKRALQVVEEIEDSYNTQKVLSQLASQYNQLGQPERALSFTWRTLKLAESAHPGSRQMWRNYLYMARTFVALKLYDAAAAFGSEMLHVAQNEIKTDDTIQYSYHYLGQIYGGLGRYEDAIHLTSQSVAIARSLKGYEAARKQGAYSLLQLAHVQRQAGRYREALADYGQAIQAFEQMELGAYKYDALKGRLLCHVALKNDFAVEAELPAVMQQFNDYRQKILEEENLNTFFDREHDIYDVAINHAYLKGDLERSFAHSEDARARSLLNALEKRKVEASHSSPAKSKSQVRLRSLAELKDLVPANVQVIKYDVLEDKTLIWLITRGSVTVQPIEIPAVELNTKIRTFVDIISKPPAGSREDLRTLAKELYDSLLGPVAGRLDAQKIVCIIPDKAISVLPFSALVSSKSGQYLINKLSFMSSLSLNVFVQLSDIAVGMNNTGHETLLSIGDPSFSIEDYPMLARLPSAAREVKGIRKYYRALEFVGPKAIRENILREMPNADVVHFAGHYLLNDHDPMLSKLVLAKRGELTGADDGSLTAGDLVGRELPRTKLVVLSACQTGAGKYYNGEGLISISRTFLGESIPLVVASQWAVDSEATAELMVKFHRYRREGALSTVTALRKAQREIFSQQGLYGDPYYWAGFLPIGGHADF